MIKKGKSRSRGEGPVAASCLRFFLAAALLGLLFGAAAPAQAQSGSRFTYQGNLRQGGFLVSGNRNMMFRIYSSSTAIPGETCSGECRWESPLQTVSISTGVFRAVLEPPLSVWDSPSLWLEVTVAGVRLAPREEITAAPLSVRAVSAATAVNAITASTAAYATDAGTAVNSMYFNGKKYPTSNTEPPVPAGGHVVGDLWMDSSIGTMALKFWNGTAWVTVSGAGLPGDHALTHAQGGGDDIQSLGPLDITGDMTFAPGTKLKAAPGSDFVNVGTNLNVVGFLNHLANLNIGGAGYEVTFASNVLINEGNLKYGAGADGKVLKRSGDGFVYWGDDTIGTVLGTPYRLQMVNAAGDALTDSLLQQNEDNSGFTTMFGSSITVTGAVEARGELLAAGALRALADASVAGVLVTLGDTRLGSDAETGLHSVNRSTETGVAFAVGGSDMSGSYAAKFYSGDTLAAWIRKK